MNQTLCSGVLIVLCLDLHRGPAGVWHPAPTRLLWQVKLMMSFYDGRAQKSCDHHPCAAAPPPPFSVYTTHKHTNTHRRVDIIAAERWYNVFTSSFRPHLPSLFPLQHPPRTPQDMVYFRCCVWLISCCVCVLLVYLLLLCVCGCGQ